MEGLATIITSSFLTATHHMKAVNNDVSLHELLADTSLCIHSAQPQNSSNHLLSISTNLPTHTLAMYPQHHSTCVHSAQAPYSPNLPKNSSDGTILTKI